MPLVILEGNSSLLLLSVLGIYSIQTIPRQITWTITESLRQ